MDAAVVGGAFLSASLQVLFDRMASRDFLSFFRGQKPTATLLRKFKIHLLAVQAVLRDAEAKQIRNSAVKEWVDELKDVVYDAEDLLDDIATEALRCKMETDPQNQVRNIISVFINPFVESIKYRVEEITDVLEFLAQQKDALGLKEGIGEKLQERLPGTSLLNDSGVLYGMDGNKEEMVQLLLSNSSNGRNISVIALVGMGGLGKTTLSNLVYNDERVKKCFELKAWVCVSDEFDLVRITTTILKTWNPTTPYDTDLNLLQLKLQEILYGKKFLLVLDDVWNENYNNWDILQTPLVVGLNGSKIIVTTRSDKVASIMRSDHIHHLKQLSFEDCWSLFAKHAFKNGDSSSHPKLENIGKEIVKKCKGLPLAAKTLGAALYSELRVTEWENLLNDEIWDSSYDGILPALRLSYNHLPSHLKQCFAYCSIFPKDFEIEKEKLILLWMAEGFLEQSKGNKTLEGIGDKYFNELLSRSFFQKSPTDKSCFVMHDLINDLTQLVSGKFCLQLKDGKMLEIHEKVRHLSYFRSKYDFFERFEILNHVNGLRTFLPLNLGYLTNCKKMDKVSKNRDIWWYVYSPEFQLSNRVLNNLLSNAQWLRVLSLCYYGIVTLPDTIENLKHLRYLDLSYTSIKTLPDSVCNLYNLQTLILTYCRNLVEFPVMMSKLIKLRHLDIRHSKVKDTPNQMGQLKSLRRLTNYTVSKKRGTGVKELRELSYLNGSLRIQDLQDVEDGRDASQANLVDKQYLDDLWLKWKVDSGVEQNEADIVLLNLQPHSNLKTLTIQNYEGLRLPDWLGGSQILTNMVSLRLWYCKNVSAFPPLGQLPCLKHLYITGALKVERVGAEFYGTDSSSAKPSFVSLKALSFQDLPELKEWVCEGGQGAEFPRLKELYIQNCPMLTGDLPVHLPLLKKLETTVCGGVLMRSPASEFTCLESLTTSNVSQWKELPPLLRELSIENAVSMESALGDGILQSNNSLQDLTIIRYSFSRSLGGARLPITMKSLLVNAVKNVEFLLLELFECHHPFLESFVILDSTCSSLLYFPLSVFPKLFFLEIRKIKGLESLTFSISEGDPTSFDRLSISKCPNLASIELTALNFSACSIKNCENLKSIVHTTVCLRSLEVDDCPELIFPIQGLPSNLVSLTITNCHKLTSLMELGLQLLTSLQELNIMDCPNLQYSLTKEGLPTSLTSVTIHNCPLLKDAYKFWRGISHNPHIVINDRLLG